MEKFISIGFALLVLAFADARTGTGSEYGPSTHLTTYTVHPKYSDVRPGGVPEKGPGNVRIGKTNYYR